MLDVCLCSVFREDGKRKEHQYLYVLKKIRMLNVVVVLYMVIRDGSNVNLNFNIV